MTVTEIEAELRAAEAHYEALDESAVTDRATKKLLDLQKRLSKAINKTPAASIAELRLKFERLLHWQASGDTWVDDRDRKLTKSILADFDRLTA